MAKKLNIQALPKIFFPTFSYFKFLLNTGVKKE